MFTGLVQTIGTIEEVTRDANGLCVVVRCELGPFALGESIAVNGACLTVKERTDDTFTADASNETLGKTNLGTLKAGSRVHLERALALGDNLGGHLVTGHIDGVGAFAESQPDGEHTLARFEVPALIRPFVAPKGSITVNGVSLTVNRVVSDSFEVMLVPYTLKETTLGSMQKGEPVNLEVDILAKYVASLLGKPGVDGSGGRDA